MAVSAVLMALSVASLRGEDETTEAIHDGFETPQVVWSREVTDAKVQLLAHDRSNRARHEGLSSERIQFEAGTGSAFYYSYALPQIVVTDPLQVGLYVRSNRVGVQLLGRVVLPADTDPDTGEPSFVLIPGTIYDAADRWQRLELVDLRPSIERQARVLRAASNRPVSLEGAYLDRLVVNLFGGPGKTEVFLDDLTIRPVSVKAPAARAPASPGGPATPKVQAGRTPNPRSRVQLEGNRLRKDGNDWLVTGVEAPGADVGALRRGGFDVLVDDFDADPERAREAIERGFLLMPRLGSSRLGRAPGPGSRAGDRDRLVVSRLGRVLAPGRPPRVVDRPGRADRGVGEDSRGGRRPARPPPRCGTPDDGGRLRGVLQIRPSPSRARHDRRPPALMGGDARPTRHISTIYHSVAH